jgi:hypothetical protein
MVGQIPCPTKKAQKVIINPYLVETLGCSVVGKQREWRSDAVRSAQRLGARLDTAFSDPPLPLAMVADDALRVDRPWALPGRRLLAVA